MKGVSWGLIVGVSIGVIIGLLLAFSALFCIRFRKRRAQIGSSSSRRAATIPIRANGADSCSALSDSTIGQESPKPSEGYGMSLWLEGHKRKSIVSVSGIPQYPYKELQKATHNFTTVLGQGAFGPVYRAQMSTGETVAVKVLATNSKQGEKEFQTEVLLLGRLHHRNLVNLVGYCAEKGQHMLVYVYMSNGSLASHLYGDKYGPLTWDLRVYIALDVARGLEYLHDGATPPVVHRDIKSSNILLDQSMRARIAGAAKVFNGRSVVEKACRGVQKQDQELYLWYLQSGPPWRIPSMVADFGLSREAMATQHASNLKGTFGYLDPQYVSTRAFTKKSDVYSYGVLLFELIAGRNPQQGLMEYVELAAISTEGRRGWEEIVDSRLDGKYDVEELNDMAALAYKCINPDPRKRASMRDVVQALSQIIKQHQSRKHHKQSLSLTLEEVAIDVDQERVRVPNGKHEREDSIASSVDMPDV